MALREPMAPYDKPCARCGCGLEGQRGGSPDGRYWMHFPEEGCIRALVARTGRLEARVNQLEQAINDL